MYHVRTRDIIKVNWLRLLLSWWLLKQPLDNILKELDDPQDQRRNIDIVTLDFFDRNQTTKEIRLIERE